MVTDWDNHIKDLKQNFSFEKVKEILDSFKDKKVLVIGDTIIDEYCFVETKGSASKDPVISAAFKKKEKYAGGILAIANHVSNFVDNLTLLTLLGENFDQQNFVEDNLNKNITSVFFEKENSPTTIKKRYISEVRKEKLFKVEFMNDSPISLALEQQLVNFLESNLDEFDIVIVGDFGHGFLNNVIIRILEEKSKFLSVNVQSNSANLGFNFVTKYNAPSFITMDGAELCLAVGERTKDYNRLIQKLYDMKKFPRFMVTNGKHGVYYFNHGTISLCSALASDVTDVVGAGDAVFSITSLLAQANIDDTRLLPFIANSVGGIAVGIMGNKRSVGKKELLDFIFKQYSKHDDAGVHDYFKTINDTLGSLDKTSVSRFCNLLLEAYNNDKTIYIFGNGGSAATASHFCGDLVKGVSCGLEKRFKVICLNDNTPAMMAIANDISYDDIFVEQLKNFLKEDDVVIGISGSGNSVNIVKALEYANSVNAKTAAICGYSGGKIKDIASFSVHAEINDMEISEDVHNLVIIHCVKRILTDKLDNKNVGEEYVKRVT